MEAVDREGLRRRVKDPFYQNTISILAMENDQVLGRIEYHFYGCMQDGYRMAYVDWVYVLPEARHKGVAQGLLYDGFFSFAVVRQSIIQYLIQCFQ